MKLHDKVKVLVSKEKYEKQDVFKGMVGKIIDAEIQFREFQVIFTDPTPFLKKQCIQLNQIYCAISI